MQQTLACAADNPRNFAHCPDGKIRTLKSPLGDWLPLA
jgi:hypothetical protein